MNIDQLRSQNANIIVQGSHLGIIQSILDYDYLLGKSQPSIKAIIARGKRSGRFFYGSKQIQVPIYPSLASLPDDLRQSTNALANAQSARNVRQSMLDAFERLPNLRLATIFAENTPERHTLDIIEQAKSHDIIITGPSSVGVVIPGAFKLGAIGGTTYEQLVNARLTTPGDVAVVSTSGGIVNELIHIVTGRNRGISFSLAMGGDRFPITDPSQAMLLAEADPQTKQIVYFGELGGSDEYRLIDLINQGKLTKPIIAYVAGAVSDLFEVPPQFGHAKAMAQSHDETAEAKKSALQKAGVTVCDRFDQIASSLTEGDLPAAAPIDPNILQRRPSLFMSHLSGEVGGDIQLLGKDLLTTVGDNSLASLTLSVLLGEQVSSKKLIDFTELVLKLLVDHSPNVSGAVNTMVTARAGKDLTASLASGLLTIGPRFGGAVNGAAEAWLTAVESGYNGKQLVDYYATKKGGIIPGIGHKKYRLDNPDPRVQALTELSPANSKYLAIARDTEAITTSKKLNLILNVDGAIAAIMLDLLESELGYDHDKLRQLVEIEFFNALFVVSRTIGFTGHYLDQKRHDEGLFRLPNGDLDYIID